VDLLPHHLPGNFSFLLNFINSLPPTVTKRSCYFSWSHLYHNTIITPRTFLFCSFIYDLFYRLRINYRRILQNHIITNTEQKCVMLLPFERGMFAVSYSPKWTPARSIGWSCSGHIQHLLHLATPVTRPDSVISSCGVPSRTMFTSHHFQRHYHNCESASTPQSGTSHKTCLRGFDGNWCIAWISAVSHEGRTSNAFKVTMKL